MSAGRLLALPATLITTLVLAAGASADSVQVTTNADTSSPTECTLRDAIATVTNSTEFGGCLPVFASGTDTITFAASVSGQTIPLSGQLVIDDSNELDIVGPGMHQLTIDGQSNGRVLTLNLGRTASISGLSMINGNLGGSVPVGGGIRNAGDLTLTDVRVANNTVSATAAGTATAGGAGIDNAGGSGGSLTLDHSVVEDNTAFAQNTAGDVTGANAFGAGIFSGAPLTIEDSVIRGNHATAIDSGGGQADAAGGLESSGLDASHSTFSGNTATSVQTGTGAARAVGGVMSSGGGNLDLDTITGNFADPTGTAVIIPAGGVDAVAGSLAIRSSTIARNGPSSLSLNGANLITEGGTATLTNTLVSDPRGDGTNHNCAIFSGTIASGGFNDDYSPGGASCFLPPSHATDLTTNPLLAGALANNGGPTETLALQPSSPVIDQGSSSIGGPDPTHDQRGLTRPVEFSGIANAVGGNGSDIGAFEVQADCAGQPTPGGSCQSPTPTPTTPSPGPTPPPPAAKKKCKAGKKASAAKKKKKCKKHKK
jgi:hypothetical protein